MDKNRIKAHLLKRFVTEDTTPGISITQKAKTESGKINKAGVKAVAKDVTKYEDSLKQTNPDMNTMPVNKFNYSDDAEKTYHDEMEILNGQEMIEYSREPGDNFKKRAEEALEGSSRMGNAIGGNAEATWGASSDDFGKNLVKRIKDSSKRRADAEIQTYGMGDVQIPTGNKVQVATTALTAGNPKGDVTQAKGVQHASDKQKIKTVKENNNNPQIKESMKRLKFNTDGTKPFKGVNLTQKVGYALSLIPEQYKVNEKEFEMTDGVLTCRVRWEGNLNEGKAVVLLASDKKMINEDMDRMKTLMGYKSQDTLGLVKGNARIDENKAFSDVWNKTKRLLGESEEIEGQKAKEGDLDDAVGVAPEATKDIEGSVPTEKKTDAPAPKTGSAESIDKAVKYAPEAKKHVEGSVPTEKKTEAPTPKTGNWEEIKKKSADATKAVESGKPSKVATDKAKVVNEEFDANKEEEEEETEDNWNKPDMDDTSTETEPSPTDMGGEVPPAIGGDDEDEVQIPTAKPVISKGMTASLFTANSAPNRAWIKVGEKMTEVPKKYMALVTNRDTTKKGIGNEIAKIIVKKMQDDADFGGEEETDELDID